MYIYIETYKYSYRFQYEWNQHHHGLCPNWEKGNLKGTISGRPNFPQEASTDASWRGSGGRVLGMSPPCFFFGGGYPKNVEV